MRAFVRYDNQGIIVPTSFVMKKTMPKVGQWKEISTSKSVSGFPAQSSQKNLRAFVRYNGKNKVVPGSVVVRGQVPAGNFSEVTYDLSRPISAGYVFLTKAELETAIDLWLGDEAQAITQYGDINTWNVSNITDMDNLFFKKNPAAAAFNSNISKWDVSNVTDMNRMFSETTSFSQSLGNWDVSNVNSMFFMFSASLFNQNISNWNVSSVTEMRGMFRDATLFNQNLSSWGVGSVTNCTDFSQGATSWTLPKPTFTNCTP